MNNANGADEMLAEQTYSPRHGGPYDRGSADSYYSRIYNPHYYVRETGSSPRVPLASMKPDEIAAYTAGYNDNEQFGNKKEWN